MTLGRRRGTTRNRRCLSCGALLDVAADFCDDQCQRFARSNGFDNYTAPRWARRMPPLNHIRRASR